MSITRAGGPDLDLVDQSTLEHRIAELTLLMRTHAGGVELVDVSEEGHVTVAFTGMCQGCRFRPMTLYATLVPALMTVPGVTAVNVRGMRMSDEAVARMREAFGAKI